MHLDVVDLRSFYYRTQLGRSARRAIREQVETLWPAETAKGQTVVGFGFAAPLLRPYLTDARRVVALMPGQQGVMHWPANEPNTSVLCEEVLWPLESGVADKIVVLHGLETSERPTAFLDECWRVLAPGGHALFIVPNRVGLWSRRDITPFGHGRPYSVGQIEDQLRKHSFTPERHLAALFHPPTHRRFWMKTHRFWEKVGRSMSSGPAGGALLVEACKQEPARPRPGLSEAVRKPLEVLDGIASPAPKPVGASRNRD